MEMRDVKRYFKHFCIPFIILGIMLVILLVGIVVKGPDGGNAYYDSTNTQRVYGDQRVFDYADFLTDKQERQLEKYIKEKEKEVCTDIVIVILNEPLENFAPEYRAKYDEVITPDKWVMVYADKFWEDNKFGYDGPQVLDGTTRTGDGVILVDNNYREGPNSSIYTWLGTTGKAERELSSSEIDRILDKFYETVDDNYYAACIDFVDKYVATMSPSKFFSPYVMLAISLIVTIIYIAINWRAKAGKVTVNARTYLIDKKADFPVKTDTFLRKTVSKVKIETSSGGGGGGGHHSSGGGGSHGGGGHSR